MGAIYTERNIKFQSIARFLCLKKIRHHLDNTYICIDDSVDNSNLVSWPQILKVDGEA